MSIMTQWKFALILVIASAYRLVVESKIFERCELAKVLHQRYRLDLVEVAQWVCIAQHSSGFNTAAQARSSTGGSHGLFQISDVYWCSPRGQGAGCNLSCHKLKDDDLSDDLSCAKRIFVEHQRISGDGYTAWNAYQQYCKQNAMSYIQNCFQGKHKIRGYNSVNAVQDYSLKRTGRIYERCELARELYGKHRMPMQQIPTWVCIAEHESRLNTAAVGRLNSDGSADHGIFQISDLYWCSHDRFRSGGGKGCGLPCSKLLDRDITDDVHCVRRIFSEHSALSGDGFTAWTVYKPYCRSQGYEKIAKCFQNIILRQNKMESYGLEMASNQISFTTKLNLNNNKNPFLKSIPDKVHNTLLSNNDIFEATPYLSTTNVAAPQGKVFTRCSLAQELFFKHNFPLQDISTWVCIAEHESQLNTAAIGRLNGDGSNDHGLFQINDRYWCDHTEQGGKACNLPCSKLLDDDIADDVACIKTIFEEHTRLSGDGFNAWTVYKPHCQTQAIEHIKTCFDEKTLLSFDTFESSANSNVETIQEEGKLYNKCELAQELYHKHRMPMEQIPKWVCIAEHESSFNTAAVGRLNTDGSADHGLFQISDLYWCSHDQNGGKACNIPCHKLLDADITDDVNCIRIIYEEHTRISEDGFNAWTVYRPHCLNTGIKHVKECFTEEELKRTQTNDDSNSIIFQNSFESKSPQSGKIYKKCELAQELYHKHCMPMEQIPKWVCIAQHESSFNTAAVGRLNTDGSADHGLFQISDLYWCSNDQNGGKACNIPCHKLLDADITDDVNCIRIIYEEHTRISGDGFNAWTVYKPHCGDIEMNHIEECFTESEIKQALVPDLSISVNNLEPSTKTTSKGKVYKKCELAQELLIKHKIPMEQIPTWVCIAQHESSFNTAAVGRLNADGSLDHGLLQISDLYWCSHDEYGGKACNIPCDKLLDSDITDDIQCIKVIYEEHARISGDGFNAWTVYKPHCYGRKLEEVSNCLLPDQIDEITKKEYLLKKNKHTGQTQREKSSYSHNPFLNGLKPVTSNEVTNYDHNPFLQNIRISSGSEIRESIAVAPSGIDSETQQIYENNPFLSKYLKRPAGGVNYPPSESFKPLSLSEKQHEFETSTNYKNNPFLNGHFTTNIINKFATNSVGIKQFKNNPFLSHIKLSNHDLLKQSSFQNTSAMLRETNGKIAFNRNYTNTDVFRTTTPKQKTATSRPTKTVETTTQTFTKTITEKSTTPKTNIITSTTTTQKPAATKTTISSLINRKSTTKPQEMYTSWNWQNQRYINVTTTTGSPKTSTTRQQQRKDHHTLTTIKPSTAVIKKPNLNLNITETATPQYQTSTKNVKTTTPKTQTTIENWRKWNNTKATKSNLIQVTSLATKLPITTENWRKWDRTPTPNFIAQNKPTTSSSFSTITTTLPTTTENWRKWDRTPTSNIIAQNKPTTSSSFSTITTKLPITTENWRKWDKNLTTTKPLTTTAKTFTAKTIATEQKSSTIRPQTTRKDTTTTKIPVKWGKTTTSKYNSTAAKTSTLKPSTTTKIPLKWGKTTTSKYNSTNTETSTLKPSTTTKIPVKWNKNTANKYNSTTANPFTTSENWKKWEGTTTNKINTTKQKPKTTKSQAKPEILSNGNKTTTTKPQNWERENKTTAKSPRTASISSKEIIKPQRPASQTSQGNEDKMEKISLKKSNTTMANIERTTSIWKYNKESTTAQPQTSTENWRKWQKTTTKKSSTNLPKTDPNFKTKQNSTTSKPKTSTENWRKWDRTTTKQPNATTKNPEKTTRNWANVKELTSRKSLTSIENGRKGNSSTTTKSLKDETTTQKSMFMITTTAKTAPTTTNKWKSESTELTTKATTAKPKRLKNLTTLLPYNNESVKTSTSRSYLNKSSTSNFTDTSADFEKYKNDPFSHPFFAKANEQFKLLHGSFTTNVPSGMPNKKRSFAESNLKQDLKNRAINNTNMALA